MSLNAPPSIGCLLVSIERQIFQHFSKDSEKKLKRVLTLVHRYTDGKLRKNGDPAMIHPLSVALRVADMELGVNSVSAALLHDIIEDNPDIKNLSDQIRSVCNADVEALVKQLTIIESSPVLGFPQRNELAVQMSFLSQIQDLRVLIIKLADVLHNIETVDGLAPERQKFFVEEVEKLYLPAANYLGINALYKLIDTQVFKFRKPSEYAEIERYIATHHKNGEQLVQSISKELSTLVDLCHCSATIEGRVKSIPGIYRKKVKYASEGKPSSYQRLLDILGFRIITNTDTDCYTIFSAIQTLYETIGDRIRDYIAKPKRNGYRSIHIIALREGVPFEIQIRTQKMHLYNEYGQASHLSYKKQQRRDAKSSDEFLWTQMVGTGLKSYQKTHDKAIPLNLFADSIFVMTPRNEIFQLPRGSNAIDFAYALHTELGNQCVGVKINEKSEPLDRKLKTGDVVEIMKNRIKRRADASWLTIAQTDLAKKCIRESLR